MAKWIEAFGTVSTIDGAMTVNVDDPAWMAAWLVSTVNALTKERDELRAELKEARGREASLLRAAEHWSACDFPDSVDFRCDGCNAARLAVSTSTKESPPNAE